MTVGFRDIEIASERIHGLVHNTPVVQSEQLNRLTGLSLNFKAEHLQKVGAFKARGAVNAICSINKNQLKHGVVTHSSGNHGAALARAGALMNVPVSIVVPVNASRVKKKAIANYGARVIECESSLASRELTLEELVENTNATFVHPYDDELIIAGAGTAALELADQVVGLDVIVTPVGGGGLLAGTTLVAQAKGIKVFGAEPAGADDAARSFRTGDRVLDHLPQTICDGLLTTLGDRNWDIIYSGVDDILVVSDEDTVSAMYLIWTRMKQVVEPSAAIALAAVLSNKALFAGLKIGIVLTGGNVDLADLPFDPFNEVGNLV